MKSFKQLMEDLEPIIESSDEITVKKDKTREAWSVYKGKSYLASYSNKKAADARQEIEIEKKQAGKKLKETVLPPKSEAEQNFVKKHVVQVIDNTKQGKPEVPTSKDKTRLADYKDGQDARVYEDIDALVSEALAEGLNLKVGIMKFDDGSHRNVTRADIEAAEKIYASTNDKSGMEKEIKKSKENFEQLIALGE